MSEVCKNNVAFIIDSICSICKEYPGKKTLQKIVYLIEEKGIDLGYKYGLHFYGPYCAKLDQETIILSFKGIINFDYSGYSHRMHINDKEWKVRSKVSARNEETIKELINRFKSKNPSQLELLTTIIYAYNNLEDKSRNSIICGVKKIKGDKYSEREIEESFTDLDYFNIKI